MTDHKLTDEEFEIQTIFLVFERAIRNAKENDRPVLEFVDVSVLERLLNVCKSQKAEIEGLNKTLSEQFDSYENIRKKAKAEAIKEVAERLKEYLDDFYTRDEDALFDTTSAIDQIAKELTEEKI